MLHFETVKPDTLALLKELMSIEGLKQFNLVGGTALSLQLGHRISVDLDLFSHDSFDNETIIKVLSTHFNKRFELISSLKNKIISPEIIVFGEVGLSGEIRPVTSGQERIREAAKHGFKKAIVPKANAPKSTVSGMDIIAVDNLQSMLQVAME